MKSPKFIHPLFPPSRTGVDGTGCEVGPSMRGVDDEWMWMNGGCRRYRSQRGWRVDG